MKPRKPRNFGVMPHPFHPFASTREAPPGFLSRIPFLFSHHTCRLGTEVTAYDLRGTFLKIPDEYRMAPSPRLMCLCRIRDFGYPMKPATHAIFHLISTFHIFSDPPFMRLGICSKVAKRLSTRLPTESFVIAVCTHFAAPPCGRAALD